MIGCWRESFCQDLPFLFVQLAPYGTWLGGTGEKYPELRRRQEMVSRRVPGAYMTSVMDLGMYEDIHPKHKKEVGERLALLARGKVYKEELLCEPPALLGAERKGKKIILHFAHAGVGLWRKEKTPEAEPEAELPSPLTGPREMKDGFLVLHVPSLSEEKCAVSFAQVPYIRVRIYNSADLPMKPFYCEL